MSTENTINDHGTVLGDLAQAACEEQSHNARLWEIDVANEWFESRSVKAKASDATGRGLIQALGYKPAESYVVLRYRPDGSLEEIGLEEPFDIAEPRENSFFVNEASEMANLVIGGVRLTWTQAVIKGLTVKRLARRDDPDLEVVLEREDQEPRVIDDEEEIQLSRPGLERLHLRKRTLVTITVNVKHQVEISRGWHTGAEIKAAAIAQGVDIKANFTLSEDLPNGGSKIIGDSDRVHIKGGEAFLAIDDHDDSGA
jgi:Multiubiquitin